MDSNYGGTESTGCAIVQERYELFVNASGTRMFIEVPSMVFIRQKKMIVSGGKPLRLFGSADLKVNNNVSPSWGKDAWRTLDRQIRSGNIPGFVPCFQKGYAPIGTTDLAVRVHESGREYLHLDRDIEPQTVYIGSVIMDLISSPPINQRII